MTISGNAVVNLEPSKRKVEALTAPRNAVLVGASDRPGSWAARVWRNLHKYEFPGAVYSINPRRTEIWDKPCYPDFKSLPEAPDHLVVLVPAAGVSEALRAGAAAGARSATVFSSGFGEAFDTEAATLGRELADVIAETGLAVSGPNCMGNVCAKTRLVTFPEDRMLTVREGPVALVGQSGGMMLFANHGLLERGIIAEYLITSGNEAGLSIGDYIAFFADQPELKVIVIYVEAIADLEKFKAACRMARAAGKHIVALKLGQSEGGRQAALAHTGSLAGEIAAFDAVAGEVGVMRADTLDDVVEITELLAYTGAPTGRNLGAITLSGAFRGLLLDGAEKNGLHFRPLEAATTDNLNAILAVGFAGVEPDRRRLRRAHQRRELHQLDRRHASRPERRHRTGAGGRSRANRDPAVPRITSAWWRTTPPRGRRSRSRSARRPRTATPTSAARYVPTRRMCRFCRRRTRRCERLRRWRGATSWSGWRLR